MVVAVIAGVATLLAAVAAGFFSYRATTVARNVAVALAELERTQKHDVARHSRLQAANEEIVAVQEQERFDDDDLVKAVGGEAADLEQLVRRIRVRAKRIEDVYHRIRPLLDAAFVAKIEEAIDENRRLRADGVKQVEQGDADISLWMERTFASHDMVERVVTDTIAAQMAEIRQGGC